ncbi:MAG TPA: TonB-dependent receptor, partial [Candidatus Saccharimonadia bacterium]|nr:TonB-dependent receptor [Candidatus Saccharimonadia bacterium]
ERIREAAAQTAMDLLHGETGTFVQQTTPGQAVIIVRGLKGSEVLHLVDGFRLNNAFFRNAPNQYIALVDGQMLDRIEVVRGPASALYGGDAMGGVVQMFSPEPRFEDGDWSAYGRLRSHVASADLSSHSRIDGAAGRAGVALSGGVSYQDVGELRTGSGGRRPFTAYRARAANAKLNLLLGDAHELMLQGQYLEQPSTPRYDELVPGFGQAQSTSVEFAFEPQVRRFAHARYRHTGGTALWDSLESQLGRQEIVDDRRTRERGTSNRELEQNSSTLDGFSLQASKALGAHYLTYGAELYTDTVRSARVRESSNTGAMMARPPRFPDGSTMDQLGVFVADDVVLGRFDFNGGLRYSRIDTRFDDFGGFSVASRNDDVSGMLGIAYALDDDWKLVSNLGRAFRPPNIFDLGTFGDRPGNRFNIPNPELEPESVTTLDIGFKHGGERWAAEAFAFASRYEDKITSVLTGETTQTGRLVVQSRNATKLELRGVEAGLRGSPRDDLDVYASATYTRGDEAIAADEYPADRIPPLFGKLGARWRASDRVTLEGYAYYAARQDRLSPRDAVDPRIDPEGTAGWVTWNARVAYRASDAIDMSLRLENIGDRGYREHGSGLDEPGFNAIVGIDWRF